MEIEHALAIFGINGNVTFDQLERKYAELLEKYSAKRYENSALEDIAYKKLNEVQKAYEIIKTHAQNNRDKYLFSYHKYGFNLYPYGYRYRRSPACGCPDCDDLCTACACLWATDTCCECAGGDCI
ncbi:MAG: hypothetical protein N2Z58_05710 [Fervidobacterium sp.]|nr:hypothetical protein [Fervidobacterium sp.]